YTTLFRSTVSTTTVIDEAPSPWTPCLEPTWVSIPIDTELIVTPPVSALTAEEYQLPPVVIRPLPFIGPTPPGEVPVQPVTPPTPGAMGPPPTGGWEDPISPEVRAQEFLDETVARQILEEYLRRIRSSKDPLVAPTPPAEEPDSSGIVVVEKVVYRDRPGKETVVVVEGPSVATVV